MALISLLTSQHPSAAVLKAEHPRGWSRAAPIAERGRNRDTQGLHPHGKMLPATFKLCAAISYQHLRNMRGEGASSPAAGLDGGHGDGLPIPYWGWAVSPLPLFALMGAEGDAGADVEGGDGLQGFSVLLIHFYPVPRCFHAGICSPRSRAWVCSCAYRDKAEAEAWSRCLNWGLKPPPPGAGADAALPPGLRRQAALTIGQELGKLVCRSPGPGPWISHVRRRSSLLSE